MAENSAELVAAAGGELQEHEPVPGGDALEQAEAADEQGYAEEAAAADGIDEGDGGEAAGLLEGDMPQGMEGAHEQPYEQHGGELDVPAGEYGEEHGEYVTNGEEGDLHGMGAGGYDDYDHADAALQQGQEGHEHEGGGMGLGQMDEDMPMPNRLQEMLSARSRSASSRTSRPASAVMDLRGSRPNSAAIAQEIEGFEDDFMERVDEEEEEEYDDMGDMGEEEIDMGPTVEELIERAQAEQSRLQDGNEALQKKVRLALDFRNKGRPMVNRDMSRLDGVATRYRSSLKQWVDTLEERDRVEAHYQSTIFGMKSTLEDRIKRADDIAKAYKHFRLEVAKSAEHSKTGRAISEKLLAQMEAEDQEKEEEVQRVRLKNIHLSNQLKRIEQTLRQKEELAEGLHLIDFEQLKIENQSLNEKIEERNEELLKLRKKTTTTVQILTHVREKLQFIEKENAALAATLEELDAVLSERRDKLGKAKAQRDTLRQKGRRIKEGSVFITNPALLEDIEIHKDKKEHLVFEIEDLKQEFYVLNDTIAKANARLASMTEELAAAGSPNVINALRSMQSQKSGKSVKG